MILHTLYKFVYKHLIDILIDEFGRILQLEINIFTKKQSAEKQSAEKHSAEKHTAHKHSAEKHTAKRQLGKISIQQ